MQSAFSQAKQFCDRITFDRITQKPTEIPGFLRAGNLKQSKEKIDCI